MNAPQLLQTSALLGLFVLLAGSYGLLHALGQLRQRRGLLVAGFVAYGLQCAVVVVVLLYTPLTAWWKAFIALSCAIYLAIPPVTWRYLTALHQPERGES